MKLQKILRSNLGFSMVEVTVAMGLLGLASLAVMNLTDNVTTASRRAETILSKSQFMSALGAYIHSAPACEEMKTTMPTFNTTKKTIEFNDWKVLGVKEDPNVPAAQMKGIYQGKEFKNFKIKSLTAMMDVNGANLGTVKIGGVDHRKAFLNIEVVIETTSDLRKTDVNSSNNKRDSIYFFNVPVIADNTGKVKYCAEEKNLQEACTTMGGKFEGGECKMDKTCKIQGTYRILTCSPHTCSQAEGPTVGNPMNGGAVGCPSGTGMQTGYKQWASTAPCSGKKCTPIPVTNTMTWYSCLDCPGVSSSSSSSTTGSSGGGWSGGGGGGGGCFVAGTQIHMFGGEQKNIEDVQVGDELADHSGRMVKVLNLKRYDYNGPIYSVNGSGYFFTPNHPFLTTTGWKSLDPKKSMVESPGLKVSMLKVGDTLIKKNGYEVIKTLDAKNANEKVYNFTVSGSHEYIAEDFAVHNLKQEFQANQE